MRRFAWLMLGIGAVACEEKKTPPPPLAEASAPGALAAPSLLPTSIARIEAPEVAVRASGSTVVVTWSAPPGTGLNEEAPFKVQWNRSEGLVEAPPETKSTGASAKDGFKVAVKPAAGAPRATLDGEIDLVVCDVATHRVCVPVRRALALGFIVTKDAPADAPLVVKLPEAKAR
jgi:hypothetical protein